MAMRIQLRKNNQKIEPGMKFGLLTVMREAPPKLYGKRKVKVKSWYCDCECGTKDHIVAETNLHRTESCGCQKYLKLEGQRFGRLLVLFESGRTKTGLKIYRCLCDCGKYCDVVGTYLVHQNTQSCGCYQIECIKTRSSKYNKYENKDDFYIGYTSKNEPFYFDIEDYDKVKDYCWSISKEGYVVAKVKDGSGNHILFHQLIFDKYVDHIGGKNTRNDNRKCNLRLKGNEYSFDTYNNMNKPLQKNNTSGCRGVTWHKRDNVWEVHIGINHKQIYLGRYSDFDEAVHVRKDAEEKYFGEYSYDNSMKLAQQNIIKEVE